MKDFMEITGTILFSMAFLVLFMLLFTPPGWIILAWLLWRSA